MENCECAIEPKDANKWNSLEDYVLHLKHLAAYDFARKHVKGKKILEVGCGAGYGTHLLSEYALSVIGVDNSAETIAYANNKYMRENLSFKYYEGSKLPFEGSLFDVVVAFQVIEHIPPSALIQFLSEIKRVLKKGGLFLSSTPNKKLRLLPFQRPWNIQHYKEYSAKEFEWILKKVFGVVEIKGLYGIDAIQRIEIARVKQNPLNVYMRWPLLKILKYIFPATAINWLKNARNALIVSKNTYQTKRFQQNHTIFHHLFVDKYKLEDFKVDMSCVSRSLDLFGICINK